MTTGVGALCFACRHWNGDRCAAYPGGIPESILFGGQDHRQPLGGEEQKDGEPILFEVAAGRQRNLDAYERLKALIS